MTIIVNPHTEQEKSELLAFLDRMNLDYFQEDAVLLSDEQKQELIARDEEYEVGKAKTYSLEEVIAHFSDRRK